MSAEPDNSWLDSYVRPFVVVDWSVLQALPSGEGLPGAFTVVLPDQLFKEVLEKGDRTANYYEKLRRLLAHPSARGRVVAGKYWSHAVLEEHSPNSVRPGPSGALLQDLSLHIRGSQDRGENPFVPFDEITPAEDVYDRKDEFTDLLVRFAEHLSEAQPEVAREVLAGGAEYIEEILWTSADAISRYLVNENGRYRSAAWQKVIRRVPDVCAAARWVRIAAWYGFVRACAHGMSEKNTGNLYDDAHYVFLAQYTKHICTLDGGMARAAQAVSRGAVKVHLSLHDVPSY